jgi:thiamine pyrophosphate-dependent acetolactate synthase large subunit-like protein
MKKFVDYVSDLVEDSPIFGLTGANTIDANSMLAKKKYIPVSSEHIGAVAASAYGWITGLPGVLFVTGAPGFLQTISAIQCAKVERWPLIVFAGYPHIDSPYTFQAFEKKIAEGCSTYVAVLPLQGANCIEQLRIAYKVAKYGWCSMSHGTSSVVIVDKQLWLSPQSEPAISCTEIVEEIYDELVGDILEFIKDKDLVVLHAGVDLLAYPQALELLSIIGKVSSNIVITTAFTSAAFKQASHILGCPLPHKSSVAAYALDDTQDILVFGIDPDYSFLHPALSGKNLFELTEFPEDQSFLGWNYQSRKPKKVLNLLHVLQVLVQVLLNKETNQFTNIKKRLMSVDVCLELKKRRSEYLDSTKNSTTYLIGKTAEILDEKNNLGLIVDVGYFAYVTLSCLKLGNNSFALVSSRYAPIGYSPAAAIGLLEAGIKDIVILIGDGALLNQIGSLLDLKLALNRHPNSRVFIQVLIDGMYKTVNTYELEIKLSSIQQLLSVVDLALYAQALEIITDVTLEVFLEDLSMKGLYINFYKPMDN